MPLLSDQTQADAWQFAFRLIDRLPRYFRGKTLPQHQLTGQAGEEAALFYLRRSGFTVVAHGWQSGRAPGDLDLVAWEGDTLCFFEVKTRSSRTVATAEAAVDNHKRRTLRRLARHYLRQLPDNTPSRFDVLSIYIDPREKGSTLSRAGTTFELFRNAFGWQET